MRILALSSVCLLAPRFLWSEDVVAVLSSQSVHYQKALQGFQDTMGSTVSVFTSMISQEPIPENVKVVVSFGTKASSQKYPQQAVLVSCMALGISKESVAHEGAFVHVNMLPRADVLLPKILELQQGLKFLAVFYVSDSYSNYINELNQACESLGLNMFNEKLSDTSFLAEHLNSLVKRPDAIWVPPDAVLVNSQCMQALTQYSSRNRVAFYVPNAKLVELGATASIYSGFEEVGRVAARAAQKILSGEKYPDRIFPEKCDFIVNKSSLDNIGIKITPDIEKKIKKIY